MATSQQSLAVDWPNDIRGQGAAIGQQIPSDSFRTNLFQQCVLHQPRLWQKVSSLSSLSETSSSMKTAQTSPNPSPAFHLEHSSC